MSEGKIYTAITAVMADVPAIPKDSKNMMQGYNFRGIDACYRVLHDILVKHGCFVVPSVTKIDREERQTTKGGTLLYTILTVKHTFYAADGSFIEAVTVGEAMDSGDKASNKAMSAAMKYALIEVFAIPTTEDNDTEAHSPEVKPKPRVQAAREAFNATADAKAADAKREHTPSSSLKTDADGRPLCPKCNSVAVVRTAGPNSKSPGSQFWACPAKDDAGSWCNGINFVPYKPMPAPDPAADLNEDDIPF